MIAIVVLTISNIIVYREAKRHQSFVELNGHKRSNTNNSEERGKHVMKASYVCFGIVTTFVLLWLPYLLNDLTELILGHSNHAVGLVAQHCALCNSLVDPLLFTCLSKHLREEARAMMRTVSKDVVCSSKRNDGDVSTVRVPLKGLASEEGT